MFRWIGRSLVSVLGGAVLVGTALWAVNDSQQQARIRRLELEKAELKQIVARLKTTRRVAQLFVAGQDRDPQGGILSSRIEFKELGDERRGSAVREFRVPGDVVYVDALVVRFTDEYVERGDALRGHSLHLFRRIFGEQQPPRAGQAIDRPHEAPTAYRTKDRPGEFERGLWQEFWDYAENPDKAAAAGVRVAQGEAVYQRIRTGQVWELSTRADGGLEFRPQKIDPLIEPHLKQSSE